MTGNGQARPRADRPQPRTCDWESWQHSCPRPPKWRIQHVEYADHLSPKFACGVHLGQILAEGEYGEGDEFYVKRIKFAC